MIHTMAHRLRECLRAPVWLRAASAFALIASAWATIGAYRRLNSPRPLDAIEWSVARRVDLDTDLLVGGDLQPLKETTVACQVEDLTDSDGVVIVSMIA